MKKTILYLFLFGVFSTYEVYAQQGIGTDLPDKSAALEIVSSKRGLLIPRFGIPDLEQAAPVTDPAHALLVFNDGTESTTPGFYWWDENANNGDGKWKAVTGEVSEPGEAEVTLIAEDPINVQNQGDNDWEISLEVGQEGEVLVTNEDSEAVWTPIEDFLNEVIFQGENGITILEDSATQEQIIQLGGVLTEENTVIETGGEDNTLAITNLTDITNEVQNEEEDIADYKILIMNDNGILHIVSPSELMSEVELDLEVINGLTQDGEQIKLGGALIEETIIETDEDNTLAIEGLQSAENKNKIVIIEEDDHTLKTIERSLEEEISADKSIADLPDYSPYIQEVNIDVDIEDIASSDIDITLPDATEAKGQVINIKLSGGEEADYYLNIKDGGTDIAYGALPHQSWVIKSNGSNWRVIAN